MDAQIDNYFTWIEGSDAVQIKSEIESIIQEAGFTILNFLDHQFQPQGYTALWLIAESHCALHTFPEESKSYVELSSCNRQMYVDFVRIFNHRYNKTH